MTLQIKCPKCGKWNTPHSTEDRCECGEYLLSSLENLTRVVP